MRSTRLAGLAAAFVLTVAIAGCSSEATSTTKPPATVKGSAEISDFYGVPDPLPAAAPGTIIVSEPVTVAGLNGTMSRVMYHSTSIDGTDIAVTGLIAVPNGTVPTAGWPVVSWAHGTTGIADACAPSLKPDGLLALANPLLANGYLVVATDFEGLGTPGRHPYVVGDSEGHSTLDIVKAAQSFPDANASKRYLVWGHSQGGHAALFAGHDAADYAPSLDLVGVVAGAPPSQLLLINAALQTSPYKYYITMAAAAFNAAYGDQQAPLDSVLTQEGIDFLANIDTMCAGDLGRAAASIDFTKLQKSDPATVPAWKKLLEANDPGTWTEPIPEPLLIIHGGADEQIPVVSSAILFDQLCRTGQVAQRWVFEGQSHAGVILPSAPSMLTWIADRFAGAAMPDPLQPPGAVVQSCGKT